MDPTPDHKFIDYFSVVLGGLVVFSFAIIIIAVQIGGSSNELNQQADESYRKVLEERIRPVGDVIIAGQEKTLYGRDAVESVAVAAGQKTEEPVTMASFTSGEEVYNSACTACHGLGIAGAPKMGEAAQWAPRISTGMETLYQHAIQGYTGSAGVMPAKGGRSDLTDEQVMWSVDYMVENSR